MGHSTMSLQGPYGEPRTHAEDSIHAFLLLLISEAFAAMVQLFSVILRARHEEGFISLFYSMLSD